MATPQVQAVRRWIMTGAVAAITVTGTLYGAGLKTDQEVKQVRLYSITQDSFIATQHLLVDLKTFSMEPSH